MRLLVAVNAIFCLLTCVAPALAQGGADTWNEFETRCLAPLTKGRSADVSGLDRKHELEKYTRAGLEVWASDAHSWFLVKGTLDKRHCWLAEACVGNRTAAWVEQQLEIGAFIVVPDERSDAPLILKSKDPLGIEVVIQPLGMSDGPTIAVSAPVKGADDA